MSKIDRLVAERVMGYIQHEHMRDCWAHQSFANGYRQKHYFTPSTCIKTAWEVVEHLRKQTKDDGSCKWLVSLIDHQHKWEAVVHEIGMDDIACECDESAPMAICLAALRAVGVPESEIQEAMR